jgi:catechol 2,3-dioxygenase-like lactoylglutathione lyase family enzyme
MSTVSVRSSVDDVNAAISFYTERLGIQVDPRPTPGFATLAESFESF